MEKEERTFQVRFNTGDVQKMKKAAYILSDLRNCDLMTMDIGGFLLNIFNPAEGEMCSIMYNTQDGRMGVFVLSGREEYQDMDKYLTGAEMQLSLRPYELEIRLDSVPGKDSVFTWTIPVQEDIYGNALDVFMEEFSK